jgi:hypothetical protein
MPNRYQREIEEILRNMERTDPKQGLGDRIRAFNRPSPRPRPRLLRTRFAWRLGTSETLLVVGVALALAGAATVYYFSSHVLVSGLLGAAALGCLLVGLIVGWAARFSSRGAAGWRGRSLDARPGRPARMPFRGIVTQFRILQLKWRYRRFRGRG